MGKEQILNVLETLNCRAKRNKMWDLRVLIQSSSMVPLAL